MDIITSGVKGVNRASLFGPGVGAEPLQPQRPQHWAGGVPHLSRLWIGVDSVKPVGWGLLAGVLEKVDKGLRAEKEAPEAYAW